jgi:hypothetical protein
MRECQNGFVSTGLTVPNRTAFSTKAKQFSADLAFEKTVKLIVKDTDRQRKTCFVGKKDIWWKGAHAIIPAQDGYWIQG